MKITKRQAIKSFSAAGMMAAFAGAGEARALPPGPAVVIKLLTTAPPVRRAAMDLAADLHLVLGTAPTFGAGPAPREGFVIEIEMSGAGERETFALRRQGRTITLSGADMRGTIFAIYQFSQDYLGVDPMYFWTDTVAPRRATIDMPEATERRFPKPVIDYRGFFTNDEDQLTGWAPAKPGDRTNISPAVMDKVYETLLRLKANMVVPSTWPFPDDPQIKAASARGLIVNQHHATPVGMNAARWPVKVPYNFTDHPDVLRRAWRNAVELYDPDQEILWTVGLRGLSDMSYAELDPSVAGSDAKMGAIIGRAIAEQMSIVRERFPKAKFVTNLWSEGANLMRKGHLRIPEDVIIAWPDQGWGVIRDDGKVSRGQGFYYHVAMLNGRANQLAEMVPVERIRSEFDRFIKADATRFALVNVSDLRAVAMTAKATMDMAWGGVANDKRAHDHYRGWAAVQFGRRAAEPVAGLYESYFRAIPHAAPGKGYGEGMELGDEHFHLLSRELLLRTMVSPPYYRSFGQTPQWRAMTAFDLDDDEPGKWIDETIARELVICRAAAPDWDALLRKAQPIERLVEPDRRNYYRYAILTMIAVNRNSNAMLVAVCEAVKAAREGRTAEAGRMADAALGQLDELDRYMAFATYGRWQHWWRGEWLTNVASTRDQLETFKKWLADPIGVTPLPVLDVDWQAYYRILHYQGNRTVNVG